VRLPSRQAFVTPFGLALNEMAYEVFIRAPRFLAVRRVRREDSVDR
jgi:hypothetical protein